MKTSYALRCTQVSLSPTNIPLSPTHIPLSPDIHMYPINAVSDCSQAIVCKGSDRHQPCPCLSCQAVCSVTSLMNPQYRRKPKHT